MKKIIISILGLLAFVPLFAGATVAGSLQESIGVGKTLSVGFHSSPTISNNSNPSVASASASGNALIVYGLSAGSTVIDACDSLDCLQVTVNVTGNILGVFTSAHPAGSWVLSLGTVYFVHSTGLIPIPTWSIFLSNGGKSSAIIQANEADLNLPLLPLMVAKDSRVVGNILGVSTTGAHAVGSWVRSSANLRIYFVSDQGLIPVKADAIMVSNGGSNGLVKVANSADLSLPILDWMVMNDPRVK